jgi:hypothetical protein
MNNLKRIMIAGLVAAVITIAMQNDATAQYPVAVQPVVPAVVGYTAERRGFFGQRVVLRPVVANVAAAPAVPVEPAVTVRRPAVEPVAAYYPPPAKPVVTTYRVPVVTTYRVPVVTTYRVPVVTTYRVPYSSFMIAY